MLWGGENMTAAQILILCTIVAYLVGMIWIGIRCGKKSGSVDDFYLGGRKLGPVVTAMSAEASDMSSWLLMGLPGLAYLSGVADATWTAIGLAIGTYLNWLLVAKRIRCYSQVTDAITLPDFLSKRYDDRRKILTSLSAIVIVIFFVPYTASAFAACGKLFASLFGVSYHAALIVSAVVIVGYCAIGGFLAASVTDLVQSIVMTLSIIVVLGFGVLTAGGWGAVVQNAQALPGYLSLSLTHDPVSGGAAVYNPINMLSMLAWGLGYFGMPHILLRFMAAGDAAKLRLSRRIATIWVVISLSVAVLIGLVGNAMTSVGAVPALAGSNSETLIVQIVTGLAKNGWLAAIVAGVILSGILAATMSTADSQLLAAASSVSQNLLQESLGFKLSEKKSILLARLTVVAIAVVGVILAFDPNSSVFEIVSFAWAGFGATFGPVVLCSLFWRRSNLWGALSGMGVGAVAIFVWKYAVRPLGGLWNIYELLPAFLLALAANVIISLLTEKPSEKTLKQFDEAAEMIRSI